MIVSGASLARNDMCVCGSVGEKNWYFAAILCQLAIAIFHYGVVMSVRVVQKICGRRYEGDTVTNSLCVVMVVYWFSLTKVPCCASHYFHLAIATSSLDCCIKQYGLHVLIFQMLVSIFLLCVLRD